MAEPIIARKAPFKVDLKAGDYHWCACGASKSQPICDGSHKGSEFTPLAFNLVEDNSVYLCACKRTTNTPYCTGAHAKI